MPNIIINILTWFLKVCKETKTSLPFKINFYIRLIIALLRVGKFLWFVQKIMNYIDIEFDTKNKTWKISSAGMVFNPYLQEIDYSDIDAIFKSNPNLFKVEEEKTIEGTFKKYVVSTV